MSAVEWDLPWVSCQMRPTSLPHYSQNGSPLRHTTSDGLDRTESVVLWGFPPNHHEEAALVTTAPLSVELCYQAVIEERDQRHIGNPLVPAIKLLDRYIQRFIRQKSRGQWRILLESSDSATNPSVTGFSWARWVARGRTRHQTFQSPSREKPTVSPCSAFDT